MNGPLAVVILAGGEGRRMGGGKALARYGDTTLIGNAVALAKGWSPLVAVAVRSLGQLPGLTGVQFILDDPDIEGPLGGLTAALAFAREKGADRVLTLPCDTPRLPADLAERLDAALTPDVLAAVAESGGLAHPTCSLWRTATAEKLPGYLETGDRSLYRFAKACGLVEVTWSIGAAGDPFANANTPDELAALQPR